MTQFHAQPYSLDHIGFYFDDIDSFQSGMDKLEAKNCEEVEIQFIDGESFQAGLFGSADIHQGNIEIWFDTLDDLDE
ncbi:MAG: antirestriction protein ArdA, partial [Candidatus Pacearchaeota archaeon]|nr:antirestriction protein ArdA [Candidatus Pacearchaeota archaeon]